MDKCTEFYDKMGNHGSDIPEPPPRPAVESKAIWDLVIEDMHKRDEMGTKKYGTRLRAFDGRDPLWDAYQEALDLVVYLRQAIFEKEVLERTNDE